MLKRITDLFKGDNSTPTKTNKAFRNLHDLDDLNLSEILNSLNDLSLNERERESEDSIWFRCKHGHVKQLHVIKEIARGANKVCHQALQEGGKNPGKPKSKAFLNGLYGSRILETNIQYSNLLRTAAEKYGRADLFLKVRPVPAEDSDPRLLGVISPLAEGTLLDFIGKLSDKQIRKFMEDLLLAGVIMENNGIYHRDLKPENIFICDGHVVVGDFDLVETTDIHNDIDGTHGYVPPGIIGIKTYDAPPYNMKNLKQDEFAIGMIFLQLLLNRPLMQSLVLDNELSVHLLELRIQELQGSKKYPDELIEIVKGLLQMDHRRRFSFEEALQKLSRIQ